MLTSLFYYAENLFLLFGILFSVGTGLFLVHSIILKVIEIILLSKNKYKSNILIHKERWHDFFVFVPQEYLIKSISNNLNDQIVEILVWNDSGLNPFFTPYRSIDGVNFYSKSGNLFVYNLKQSIMNFVNLRTKEELFEIKRKKCEEEEKQKKAKAKSIAKELFE